MGTQANYDDFRDDFYQDEFNRNENTSSFNPQPLERDTFKQRNDPQILLWRLKLSLLNAFEVEENFKDKDGSERTIKKIKRKKNTTPLCNKQGIEEIISYVEKFINSHTVQGNIDSIAEYNNRMRYISNDLVLHFVAKRKDWELSLRNCDVLISTIINLIDLFLTRPLFNEERKGYGEAYKETTHHENRPVSKTPIWQKAAGFLFPSSSKKGGKGFGGRY